MPRLPPPSNAYPYRHNLEKSSGHKNDLPKPDYNLFLGLYYDAGSLE